MDAKADMLIYGNGERPLVELAHRLAAGEPIEAIKDIRNTAIMAKGPLPGWSGVDSTRLDKPGRIDPIPHPYGDDLPCVDDDSPFAPERQPKAKEVVVQPAKPKPWEKTYVLLPSYEKVKNDKVMYAHASRILHHETNPGCARALLQKHGDRYIWINPPAIPLSTEEMDSVFGLPSSGCLIRPMKAHGFPPTK